MNCAFSSACPSTWPPTWGTRLYASDASACVLCIRFSPSARHLQRNGVVQGVVVATMLDFGLAVRAVALLEPPASAATVALHVQLERAVKPSAIEVRTVVDRLGGRLAFAGATLSLTALAEVLVRASAPLAVARGPVSPVAG